MRPLRVIVAGCALVLGATALPARAGEVVADAVCRTCGPAPVSYYCAPVTTYCARTYYEPVTTYRVCACCDPCKPVGPIKRCLRRLFHPCCPRPAPVCPPPVVAVPVAPVIAPRPFVPPPPPAVVPPVDLGRPTPPPPDIAPMPPATGSSFQRLTPPLPPPAVRVERIAAAPGAKGLQGQVVSAGNAPRAHARLTLVNASRPELRQAVRADAAGRFEASVVPGEWRVYSTGANGRAVLHGTVEVRAHQTYKVTVVAR